MRTRLLIAALALTAVTSGCGREQADAPAIDKAWLRLPAVPGRPAAAYFTLHGGRDPARLIEVRSDRATSIELHESMKGDAHAMTGMAGMAGSGGMSGGAMMTMRKLDGVELPARGEVRFAPGGYHAMVFGLDPRIVAGDRVALSFRFAKGEPIRAEAKAVAAGDPDPS